LIDLRDDTSKWSLVDSVIESPRCAQEPAARCMGLMERVPKVRTSLFYRAIACLDCDVSSPEQEVRSVAKFMHLPLLKKE
jgi:hypothetical protein